MPREKLVLRPGRSNRSEPDDPTVQVVVPSVFLPDSEIQYHVTWRNIARIDFTLTRIDLTRDVRFAEKIQQRRLAASDHSEAAARCEVLD